MDFKEGVHFQRVCNELDVITDYDLLEKEMADEDTDVVDFINQGVVDG